MIVSGRQRHSRIAVYSSDNSEITDFGYYCLYSGYNERQRDVSIFAHQCIYRLLWALEDSTPSEEGTNMAEAPPTMT